MVVSNKINGEIIYGVPPRYLRYLTMNIVWFALVSALLLPQLTFADSIKRVVRDDGVIEYTNVPNSDRKTYHVEGTSDRTSYIYKYNRSDDVVVYTNQKPEGQDGVQTLTFKVSCYACDPDSTINWKGVKLHTSKYLDFITQASEKHQVDAALIRAVIHAESAFNPSARSPVGAQGLMQLMPGTAKDLGVTNSLDPEQNINGGAKYLAQMLATFDNDIALATAAYNAGPIAVKKYNGIPPYAETQVYVKRVKLLLQRYQDVAS